MAIAIGSNTPFFTIGGQAELEGLLSLVLTPANLSLASQTIINDRVIPIVPANLTATGGNLGDVGSSAWQYLNVTSTSLIGQEATLFNMLSAVTPVVGDKWRLPRFSSDGGEIIGYGNGRFQISQPTAGPDSMENILFYDKSEDTWHGPQTATIYSAAKNLPVIPPNLSCRGNIITLTTQRDVVPTSLSLTGQDVRLDTLTTITTSLSLAGATVYFDRGPGVLPATLAVSGKDIVLGLGEYKLFLDPASLGLSSAELLRSASLPLTPSNLALTSKALRILSLVYDIEPSTLGVGGKNLFLLSDANPLQVTPARLSMSSNDITIEITEGLPYASAAIILGL